MRLKKDDSSRYIHESDNIYFQTQGKGKSQTINAFSRGKHYNMGPVFVAGDSTGDYNIMIDFDGMQLGLILNRYKNDAIKELSQIAASTIGNADARQR